MAFPEPIAIKGLAEFSRNLRKIDNDLPKALRLAGNEAADIIVQTTRPKVPTGPAKGGHASTSIKAKSTRTSARVTGGGARYPYYAWLDFGGKTGRHRSVSRPFKRTGRYLWASYVDKKAAVQEKYEDELIAVVTAAGIEVE